MEKLILPCPCLEQASKQHNYSLTLLNFPIMVLQIAALFLGSTEVLLSFNKNFASKTRSYTQNMKNTTDIQKESSLIFWMRCDYGQSIIRVENTALLTVHHPWQQIFFLSINNYSFFDLIFCLVHCSFDLRTSG